MADMGSTDIFFDKTLNTSNIHDLKVLAPAAQSLAVDLKRRHMEMFTKIDPSEFNDLAWSKPKLQHQAPNILAMITESTNLSFQVRDDILLTTSLGHQINVYNFYVKLMDECIKSENYFAALAIYSGLVNASVKRLKHLSEDVEVNKMFEKCEFILRPAGHYRQLEKAQGKAKSAVPFLGNFVNNLTLIREAEGNKCQEDERDINGRIIRKKGDMNQFGEEKWGQEIKKFQKYQAHGKVYLKKKVDPATPTREDMRKRIERPKLDDKMAYSISLAILERKEGAKPNFSDKINKTPEAVRADIFAKANAQAEGASNPAAGSGAAASQVMSPQNIPPAVSLSQPPVDPAPILSQPSMADENALKEKEGADLYHNPGKYDPIKLGDILGDGKNRAMLKGYVGQIDFKGKDIGPAFKDFLEKGGFKLPGEAQKIDRFMEAFAHKYTQDNPQWGHPDNLYVIAFALTMLNTDLHNPAIPSNKKMTKAQFIKNTTTKETENMPNLANILGDLYDYVKANPIQLPNMPKVQEAGAALTEDQPQRGFFSRLLRPIVGVVNAIGGFFVNLFKAIGALLGVIRKPQLEIKEQAFGVKKESKPSSPAESPIRAPEPTVSRIDQEQAVAPAKQISLAESPQQGAASGSSQTEPTSVASAQQLPIKEEPASSSPSAWKPGVIPHGPRRKEPLFSEYRQPTVSNPAGKSVPLVVPDKSKQGEREKILKEVMEPLCQSLLSNTPKNRHYEIEQFFNYVTKTIKESGNYQAAIEMLKNPNGVNQAIKNADPQAVEKMGEALERIKEKIAKRENPSPKPNI